MLVFARVPALGRVKSRLAAGVGEPAALAIYHELLAITHAAIQEAGVPATIWLADTAASHPSAAEVWHWPNLAARCQPAGDLGTRMATAFAVAFAEGAQRVAIIGTDCPGLRAAHLAQAFALLTTHDVVLGPATDGGYYLLGLCQPQPELFYHKAWSTDSVLADTLADARRLGLRVALLPELRDVDTADDLAAWRADDTSTTSGQPDMSKGTGAPVNQ
ncbi:TIGR04282 family arsenosugar biosynthesis glycosyltransferase [Hymenobacter negativus]|uniref:TIGR04282 family arsenosugar biosynthesis glycosyltransferase n=1 Tax=Hymenobacter negativus TaxID=2795026 RepID=A0ABS3QQ59_9BACT|nr:TIGR04282 family arsenosugar biosynthesis glycosyltransferase [Hymenobacter negativus]MBO2012820.1 TIGR04282 family arsenosugar biosynthesis glycosyltransferase [Hymenobacter negativus]